MTHTPILYHRTARHRQPILCDQRNNGTIAMVAFVSTQSCTCYLAGAEHRRPISGSTARKGVQDTVADSATIPSPGPSLPHILPSLPGRVGAVTIKNNYYYPTESFTKWFAIFSCEKVVYEYSHYLHLFIAFACALSQFNA